jgi:hypothetical protein
VSAKPPRWLSEPVAQYVILFALSVAAATLFYFLGGSLASVSGNSDTFLGFGFKATGAIAAFAIIFIMSVRSLPKLKDRDPQFRPLDILMVRVRGNPKFSADNIYDSVFTVSHNSGGEEEYQPRADWDPPFLVFELRNIRHDDRIRATIKSDKGDTWEISSFFIWDQLREALRRGQAKLSTWADAELPARGAISVKRTYVSAPIESIATQGDRITAFRSDSDSLLMPNDVAERSVARGSATTWQRSRSELPQGGRVIRGD